MNNINLETVPFKASFIISFDPIIILFIFFILYVVIRYYQCLVRRLNVYSYLSNKMNDRAQIYNIDSCPICLGEFKVPVRASCGHAFCMKCLLTHFKRNNYIWKCTCPLCRELINYTENLQTYNFSKKEAAQIKKMENQLVGLIKKENTLISRMSKWQWIRQNRWKSISIVFSTAIVVTSISLWIKDIRFIPNKIY